MEIYKAYLEDGEEYITGISIYLSYLSYLSIYLSIYLSSK